MNEVEATWAEVTNQYKRRADLIPNPVKTVKAYAAHEKLQQFQKLQGNPEATLGKLMVVAEVLEPSSKNLLTATLSPTPWRPDSSPHG